MKLIKKFIFKIKEIIWLISAGIEDWLYPYCDRPVDYHNELYFDNNDEVDDISNIYSQLESANERIQRLQSEMVLVLSKIDLTNDEK